MMGISLILQFSQYKSNVKTRKNVKYEKKTIGEVLRLARINQGLSLDELQKRQQSSWIC